MRKFDRQRWTNLQRLTTFEWNCGFCGAFVASEFGYLYQEPNYPEDRCSRIHICPSCGKPSFVEFSPYKGSLKNATAWPATPAGEEIAHLPEPVATIYEEARRSFSANAFTACVMLCRALLMHIAVEHGDAPGRKFVQYVEFLLKNGIVPEKKGRDWLTHVKDIGNEANHEVTPLTREKAELLLNFLSFVLRFNYEFPAKLPAQ